MDAHSLAEFLLWCAAANYGLLLLSFGFFLAFRDWMHRVHQRWFALPGPWIDVIVYAWFGAYKLAIWFLLLVPAAVLLVLG